MELKTETKYDFSDHSEILQVLKQAFETKVSTDPAIMAPVHKGIKEFMETRTNSDLIDLADLDPCIWDYHDEVVTIWQAECNKRSFPVESEFYKELTQLSQYYNDKDSLEFQFKELQEQVKGMQKKVDRMVKILTRRKFTMRFKDLLGL